MAVRQIVTGEMPVLRGMARPVPVINRSILRLLDDMVETMYHFAGVGLAAPQLAIPKRIVVLDPGENLLVEMINPGLTRTGGDELGVEGCLSLPGLTGEVPRAEKVLVHYLDRQGRRQELEADHFLARIVQHELDHLNGVLFVDRAVRMLEPPVDDQETKL